VVDESYRHQELRIRLMPAFKALKPRLSISFRALLGLGILDFGTLHHRCYARVTRLLRAELPKLNAYPTGGFFKAHPE